MLSVLLCLPRHVLRRPLRRQDDVPMAILPRHGGAEDAPDFHRRHFHRRRMVAQPGLHRRLLLRPRRRLLGPDGPGHLRAVLPPVLHQRARQYYHGRRRLPAADPNPLQAQAGSQAEADSHRHLLPRVPVRTYSHRSEYPSASALYLSTSTTPLPQKDTYTLVKNKKKRRKKMTQAVRK